MTPVRPEAAWTLVALLAVVAVAVPATRERLEREAAGGADLTIEVRASQWRWEYTYLDETGERRFGFAGRVPKDVTYLRAVDRPLVIPAQRKVRLLVTSADVVHAFWVPELGIRVDAVPGVVRTVWVIPEAPGTYRGQCAAFCGARHAFMPAVVEVRSAEAFDDWQRDVAATLVAQAGGARPGADA